MQRLWDLLRRWPFAALALLTALQTVGTLSTRALWFSDEVRYADAYAGLLRGKWLVLYFYPKNDTPGCTEEACSFRDDMAQLSRLGAQVVGVSIDSAASNADFADKYHLPFQLLADKDGAVAKRYGAYADWTVARFARRYTFLIDAQGKIVKTYLKVDTSKHSAEIIADLKQLSSSSGK